VKLHKGKRRGSPTGGRVRGGFEKERFGKFFGKEKHPCGIAKADPQTGRKWIKEQL